MNNVFPHLTCVIYLMSSVLWKLNFVLAILNWFFHCFKSTKEFLIMFLLLFVLYEPRQSDLSCLGATVCQRSFQSTYESSAVVVF